MSATASLNSEETLKSISLLKSLVQSSIGPDGGLKILSNGCGGQPQVTSSSVRLLNVTRMSNPVLRVVAHAAAGHLKRHNNDGLYLLSVTLELLEGSLRLVPVVPQCSLARLNRQLADAARRHLQHDCGLRVRVGFDDLHLPVTLADSVLSSKPACGLTDGERGHLATLLTRAFLYGVTAENRFAGLHFVSQVNRSPSDSSHHAGVFVPVAEGWPEATAGSVRRRCALFRVSLSGDAATELVDDAANTFLLSDGVDVVGSCTTRVLELCGELLEAEVDVVGCQKVVHPRAKMRLQDQGVLVLDRLGIVTFEALLELTGCCAIESFVAKTDPSNFGTVDNVSVRRFGRETFHHLHSSSSSVSTVLLCNYLEESLEELKVVCRQTVDALRGLVQFPYVYPGGGCLETHLAVFVRHWAREHRSELLKIVGNEGQVNLAVANFSKCLERVGTSLSGRLGHLHTDDVGHHLWQLPDNDEAPVGPVGATAGACRCGLMDVGDPWMSGAGWQVVSEVRALPAVACIESTTWTKECSPTAPDRLRVVDGATSKFDAFNAALETAVTLLSVDVIVRK